MKYGWKKCKHKMKVKDVISSLESMLFDAALIINSQGNPILLN